MKTDPSPSHPVRPHRQYLWPVVWTVLGIIGYTILLVFNPTAREVSGDTAKVLFSIFSTPFVLETTFALIGIFIVMGINHWRLDKEGDGWVYMVSQEADESEAGAKISQRLQGVIFQDKPLFLDQESTAQGVIEGYLDLGMAAQALKELQEQTNLSDDAPTAALRIRVLAANIDTDLALSFLNKCVARFPESKDLFHQAARANTIWLQTHLPDHESIRVWENVARDFA
ncbi:hypothetical protein BH11VER1_BH11VER1_34250 [soil metagenome]